MRDPFDRKDCWVTTILDFDGSMARICEGRQELAAVEAEIAANKRLIAAAPAMHAALQQAEAVLSIVEPRSHKHEYLAALQTVRDALAATEAGG